MPYSTSSTSTAAIVAIAPNTVSVWSPNEGSNRKMTTASTASMKLATVNSGIL